MYTVGRGTLKSITEAVVGTMAALTLKDCHFTKGFFGTNGATRTAGFTTPDVNEALVKRTVLEQCRTAYVLCDNSSFMWSVRSRLLHFPQLRF